MEQIYGHTKAYVAHRELLKHFSRHGNEVIITGANLRGGTVHFANNVVLVTNADAAQGGGTSNA